MAVTISIIIIPIILQLKMTKIILEQTARAPDSQYHTLSNLLSTDQQHSLSEHEITELEKLKNRSEEIIKVSNTKHLAYSR